MLSKINDHKESEGSTYEHCWEYLDQVYTAVMKTPGHTTVLSTFSFTSLQHSGYKISTASSHRLRRTQHPMHPSRPPPDPSCLSRLPLPSFLAKVNRQSEPLLSVPQVSVLLKHTKSTIQ